MDAPRLIRPAGGPLDAEVRVPGGRSVTNRALVAAALAPGRSEVRGAGLSDDTEAMTDCLRRLGADIETVSGPTLLVDGVAGRPRGGAELMTRLSGTTSRFLTAVAALATDPVLVDALEPMRARPMADLLAALRALGATVIDRGEAGHLPVEVHGPPTGSEIEVPGTASSQFTSGLLLVGPTLPHGLTVRQGSNRMVSAPYVAMTVAVMEAFGAEVASSDGHWTVAPGGYRPCGYRVEPDAATASYFLAAAALCGGRVRVHGLVEGNLQGDAAVVDVLAAMGCTVRRDATGTTVTGPPPGADGRPALAGGTFDLTDLSDMAPTVAVVAAGASGPTRVTGVGFIRDKETDRIAAIVTELRRCGVDADEEDDGFVVRPRGGLRGATVSTYQDHRIAMAFALLGLVTEGIRIRDPGCVAKTHPGFFADLDRMTPGGPTMPLP